MSLNVHLRMLYKPVIFLPVVPPASLVFHSTVSLQVAVIILVFGAKLHAAVGGRPLLHHTAPAR